MKVEEQFQIGDPVIYKPEVIQTEALYSFQRRENVSLDRFVPVFTSKFLKG